MQNSSGMAVAGAGANSIAEASRKGGRKSAYADGALGSVCQKTRLCQFHAHGFCRKGHSCTYAHGKEELRAVPDLSCTKLCPRTVKRGHCDLGAACHFAHDASELRFVRDALPTKKAKALWAQWRRRGAVLLPRARAQAQDEPAATAAAPGTARSAARNMPRAGIASSPKVAMEKWSSESTHEGADSFDALSTCDESDRDTQFGLPAFAGDDFSYDVIVVRGSFALAAASGQLVEGARILHEPSGMRLVIRRGFFDIDDEDTISDGVAARACGHGRARSADGRLEARHHRFA